MIRHLFKMIWNKKKQNFLMIVEIFVSFLVLFAVFSLVVYNSKNYSRPIGMDYKNVWAISLNLESGRSDSMANYYEPISRLLKSFPEIENISWTGHNFPFSMSSSNNGLSRGKERLMADVHTTDDDYQKVIGAEMLEGRWFGKQDDGAAFKPLVINQVIKDKFFPNESPIGKSLDPDDKTQKERIVGVVNNFKDKDDFQSEDASFYRRVDKSDKDWHVSVVLIKLKNNQGAGFEEKIHKEMSKVMRGANIEIEYLTKKLADKNKITLIPMIIFLIVCSFLVLNVSLGLFGILWYNINRRKGEIGLRRAVGASGRNISWQFIAEAIVLTTLALIIGFFFAVQLPLLNVFDVPAGVYLMAILLAALFIYILVLICAFYPGKQAAGIYPAVALHED